MLNVGDLPGDAAHYMAGALPPLMTGILS